MTIPAEVLAGMQWTLYMDTAASPTPLATAMLGSP